MADISPTLRAWSATPASNQPQDATTIGTGLDDNLRELQAVVRKFLASPASNMASAGTVDLSTADGFHIHITGTTTITALGTESIGITYLLEFDGALTFTHNATTLDLPGDANITTVAGDVALMISKGSGNWKCVYYTRASGASVGGVTVANEAADTTCFPLFATAATGDLQPKTNANLTYNSSTGAFGITGIQTITANSASAGLAITQAGAGHALTVSSGDAICLDGSASGDTYISETATNGLGLTAGGIEAIRASPVGVSISNSAAQVVTAGFPIRLHTVLDGSLATSAGTFVDANYTLTAAASTARGIYLNTDFETNSVNGTISLISGGTVMGAYLQTAITGTVATSMAAAGGVFMRVANDSSTLVIGTAYGYSGQFTNNSTGSITTQVMFYASATVATGTTNAYGFQGALASAANVWNLYMSGTAANHLGGSLFIGDTSNANSTLGLTLNQGANDDDIFSLKSSDVAHDMTSIAEADTYGKISKSEATSGGMTISGLKDADGVAGQALQLFGSLGEAADATKTTAGTGIVCIVSRVTNGAGSVQTVAADGNLLVVRNNVTTRFILDADGDSHQDVGTAWTNFDHLDDIATLDALAYNVARADDPIKRKFGDFLLEKRDALEQQKIVTFNDDGHHFVNMSKLTMLNTGAIRQIGERMEHLMAENARLSATLQRLEHRA